MADDMPRYVLLFERGEHNFGSYVPDVPGCVAAGATPEEVAKSLREALAEHLALLAESGEPAPLPTVTAREVEVDVPIAAVR
jgi:predicted RNase H-like HicB family nuclease